MSQPQETIGESPRVVNYIETETGAEESGPFHLYSPGESFYRLSDITHGLNKVIAGEVAFLEKAKVWYGAEQVPEGAEQRKRQIVDDKRRVTDRFSQIHIPPAANRDRLLDVYRNRGLVEVKAFAGMDAEQVSLPAFNTLIAPQAIVLGAVTDEALVKAIEIDGGLAVRQKQVYAAQTVLKKNEKIQEQLGAGLVSLYLDAIQKDILPSFAAYRVAADIYLNSQEVEIKKNRKAYYDERDLMIMWLLGRKPKDEALSRSLEGASGGLDAAAIKQLVESLVDARETGTTEVVSSASSIEQMQCPECGSVINMVAGGPPRKCLPCGFRFDTPPPVEQESPTKAKANSKAK